MLLPYIEHRWGEVQTNYIIFWHLFENLRIIDVGSRYSYSKWFANLSSKYHRYTPGQKKIAQIALYEVKPDYTQWSRSKLASICALLLRYTEGCVNVNQNFAYLINIVHKNDTEKPSVQQFKTALLSIAEYRRSYHNLIFSQKWGMEYFKIMTKT